MAVEEIYQITWEFYGERLDPWQAAQRLYKAGFTDAKVLAIGYAVMMAESGRYLKAWHHNVRRNDDGSIKRDEDGLMEVVSTDLGFIQKNVVHHPSVKLPTTGDESKEFVDGLYEKFPELARGDESAQIAYALYQDREWAPWYAYSNGSYKKGLPAACAAVGNMVAKQLLNEPFLLRQR
jgi:hypothetical protein